MTHAFISKGLLCLTSEVIAFNALTALSEHKNCWRKCVTTVKKYVEPFLDLM